MTVSELIEKLKVFPQEAEVRVIRDFEDCDEFNNTNSEEITYVDKQYVIDDPQFASKIVCDFEVLIG